jgi:CubicO group peptidase (beta-lactamase class C family)
LTHGTGFPNWRRMTNGVLTFKWKPGTNTGYSGEGYEYLGTFVQKKLGTSFFDTLASQYVFGPIGMKHTSYIERGWFAGHISAPYDADGNAGAPELTTEGSAADLVRTTASDYARFLISVMNDEMLTAQIATERQTIARDELTAQQERTLCDLENLDPNSCMVRAGMGLGWAIFKGNETVLWHDGSDSGVHTLALFVPDRKFGLVIFTNGDNGRKLIHAALDQLYPNPAFAASMAL